MSAHERDALLSGEIDQVVRLVRGRRKRLLDEHVLAGLHAAAGELVVRKDGGREDHAVDKRVFEHLIELERPANCRIAPPD